MGNGVYSAMSGATAQARYLDIIANNLANVGTVGYKADDLTFSDHMVKDNVNMEGDRVITEEKRPLQVGLLERTQDFVKISGQFVDLNQGRIKPTGNALDLALDGNGFFLVRIKEKEFLTRDGSLSMDTQGNLMHSSGGLVLDDARTPIKIGEGAVEIAGDGSIIQNNQTVGKIGVFGIEQPRKLIKSGLSLLEYTDKDNPPTVVDETKIIQGALEQSNVNPIREMTKMIKVNRHFEFMNKVINTYKETDKQSIQGVGRIAG